MGTHPIFESDFDCLTDNYRWDVSSVPVVRAPVASSRPSPEHAKVLPSTDQLTSLSDMVLSGCRQGHHPRSRSWRPLDEGGLQGLLQVPCLISARTLRPSSPPRAPPPANPSTAEPRLPFTLATCSPSARCPKVPHAAPLR